MDLEEAKISIRLKEAIPYGDQPFAVDVAYGLDGVTTEEVVDVAFKHKDFKVYELTTETDGGQQYTMHEVKHRHPAVFEGW